MAKIVDLAIVIPTLNEERYIGHLLDSIIGQSVQPKEVVVVDAFSADKTKPEVQSRQKILPQLKFFQIPKSTISTQRNHGVKKTTATHILFLDADVFLKNPLTLEKYYTEVLERKPDLAAATNLPADAPKEVREKLNLKSSLDIKKLRTVMNKAENTAIFVAADMAFKATKPIWPMAMGINLYVKREAFEKAGGFDEKLRFAEDHELVQRMCKSGNKFLFLKDPKIYTSTRRMDHEGRFQYVTKMIKSFLHVITKGYHSNPTEYKYGHFK
jgi:glycosyltransferase involved in cell wall biosynthesis